MNNNSAEDIDKKCCSFWKLFRLVFTLFSLYLMGDAFYRWDAFKFHSSFTEYLPNVALMAIIWSIVAFLSSSLVWLLLKTFEQASRYAGLKVKAEHLLLYISVFLLLVSLAWIGKKIIWSHMETSHQLKLTIIVFISCAAIPLTWLIRSKAGLWINTIQEHVTPLVRLFAACVMLSLLLVGFYMWGKNTGKAVSEDVARLTVSGSEKNAPIYY